MANCCSNSFFSDTLDAPDCSIDCLSAANPGAIFVGANGDIYILIGDDPCSLSNWKPQASCCLNFTNLTDNITICCNEELIIRSSDNSIDVVIDEMSGIDLKSNFSITFTDDYSNEFELANDSIITLSDASGVHVEIVEDGHYLITGNSYFGSGAPSSPPSFTTMTNFYFDTTNNVLYVWKTGANVWIRINYLSSPVSLFSYTKGALSLALNGSGSTSTQVGTTITYQWIGTGPSTVVFSAATSAITNATVTVPGDYVITLTVTDSNGNTKAFSQTINIEPKARCDVKFEIPSGAFLDPDSPLDSEVNTWIAANGPFNNHTILYTIGSGTATSPQFIWIYTC